MTDLTVSKKNEAFGHPKGLFYLFFAELWERFSFYGMRALLMLYMTEQIFSALSNRDYVAAGIFAGYGSLVYATPVLGGLLADRLLGYRNAITLGGILMAIGHIVLAFESDLGFFAGLGFIIIGNGYFKPNISTFVGTLYKKDDVRKDAGFTIFYMGINIGAAVAPIACGWLGREFGWHYGFGLAGLGMALGVIVFRMGINKGVFGDKGHSPAPELMEKKTWGIANKWLVPLLSFLAVPIAGFAISYGKHNWPLIGEFMYEGEIINWIFTAVFIIIAAVLIKTMIAVSREDRERLIVAIFFTLYITLFWAFYEMSGSTLTLFAQRNVNLVLIDASQTNFLVGGYIVLLALPFAALWRYLDRTGRNPGTPLKFVIGLACLALGYYFFALSGNFADEQHRVPFFFMLVGYFFFCFGEMFVSPIGLSKIVDLSPKQVVSFMMGVWFLASALAFRVVGFVSKELAVEGSADSNNIGSESLLVYTDGFELIAKITLGGAVFALVMIPLLKKWSRGVH